MLAREGESPSTSSRFPTFPILHVAEMWKRGHNNLIQVALVFIPFRIGEIIGGTDVVDLGDFR